MQGISAIRDGCFRTDARVVAQLCELLAPSYVDARSLLLREMAVCDTLYLHHDALGRLDSFFLTARKTLIVTEKPLHTAYLGLSATRQDAKNSAVVRELYAEFLKEAAEWERLYEERLVLWFTTATPSVCLVAHTMFYQAEPREDGTYTDGGANIAQAIRMELGVAPSAHPFVLKGIAGPTRYSELERRRIRAICTKRNFTLLDDLGVEEDHGDRLLYVCYVPPWQVQTVIISTAATDKTRSSRSER